MTKKDIVRTISEELGLTQELTKKVVQRTFDSIIDTLIREGRIELRNFGVFEVKSRSARKARNPLTGTEVDVPRKNVVSFKAGKVMEAEIQKSVPEPEVKLPHSPKTQTKPTLRSGNADADVDPDRTSSKPSNRPDTNPTGNWL
ncbi:MAG: HU family DNA-binding protein [Planctomycetota bacterium]